MANYSDYAGMFGDKYSTQASINDAMLGQAHSMGQLSSYGMGQASTYYQAAGGGTPMGSMLTQANPMMQRQNLLDELQKKHPNPDTPEKLNALASDLGTNGFGDMAMKVRQAAMEMSKNEATKVYNAASLLKPTADDWKKIGRTLEGSVLNTDVIDAYLGIVESQLVAYDDNTYKGGKDNFNSRRDRRIGEVKNLIQQFADSYQGGFNKTQIEEAIGNDAALTEKFIEWIGTHGNTDVAGNLLTAMGRVNPRDATSDADGSGDGDWTTVEVTAEEYPVTFKWSKEQLKYRFGMLDAKAKHGQELTLDEMEIYQEFKDRIAASSLTMATDYTDGAWWAYG